jgi:hypothetical protein
MFTRHPSVITVPVRRRVGHSQWTRNQRGPLPVTIVAPATRPALTRAQIDRRIAAREFADVLTYVTDGAAAWNSHLTVYLDVFLKHDADDAQRRLIERLPSEALDLVLNPPPTAREIRYSCTRHVPVVVLHADQWSAVFTTVDHCPQARIYLEAEWFVLETRPFTGDLLDHWPLMLLLILYAAITPDDPATNPSPAAVDR